MSFCRITGRSRGLPKPNYFPLLPPISPADARRFCRITGKAFGLPTHCYIPVLLTTALTSNRIACKVTHSSDLSAHHYEPEYEYGKRKHIIVADYRYVFPRIDETNDQQKYLLNILNSKDVQCEEHNFVYSIKEQKCNLVFSARLEAAVRDGDVRDVMFAKTNDSVLLCMNKGKSVSLDLQDYDLHDGDGAAAGAVEKHLFEGEGPRYEVLMAREAEQQSKRGKAKKGGSVMQRAKTIDKCNGSADDEPLTNGHHDEMKPQNGTTSKTADEPKVAQKIIVNGTEVNGTIPNQNEIFKIMQNYSKGTVINDDTAVSGLSINIGTDEVPRNVMILGCIVNTADGDVFVAGRSVTNDTTGESIFEPGIYVQSKNGPTFIPGQIIYTEEEGERFVPGQVIETEFGPRFVPGKIHEVDGDVTFTPAQIVQTDQGPKFIAPDLCDDENGESKYSVQSFMLSPDDLNLLKPMHIWTNAENNGDGVAIEGGNGEHHHQQMADNMMKMFNQLLGAGIVVGSSKQSTANQHIDELLQNTINEQIIWKFADSLGCEDVKESAGMLKILFDKIKQLIGVVEQSPRQVFRMAVNALNGNNSSGEQMMMMNGGVDEHIDGNGECAVNQVIIDRHLMDIISRTVVDCISQSKALAMAATVAATNGNNLHANGRQKYTNSPMIYEIISKALAKNLNLYLKNCIIEANELNSTESESAATTIDICFGALEHLLATPDKWQQIEKNVTLAVAKCMHANKVDLIRAMINGSVEMSKQTDTTAKIHTATAAAAAAAAGQQNEIQSESMMTTAEAEAAAAAAQLANESELLENICVLLQNEMINELHESVRHLVRHEPSVMHHIISELQKQTVNLTDEHAIADILRKCVVTAVQKLANDDIKQIVAEPNAAHSEEKLNIYLNDTIQLARALGFTDCILNMSNIMNDGGGSSGCSSSGVSSDDDNDGIVHQIDQIEANSKTFELLQRVIVMHKLAQNDPVREKALQLLRCDPYSARSDCILRDLLRCSGICTINMDDGKKLIDSNDVPISLIYSQNQLAITDFFLRTQTKPRGAILICKDRFQAVVPRESSRDVLTGKCSYTVLDEHGIRHFEPLHMFTALKLQNVTMFEDRFASYLTESLNGNGSDSSSSVSGNSSNGFDIDIDQILNMSAIAAAATANVGFIAYKSTLLPRRDLEIFTKRRSPLTTAGSITATSAHGLIFDRNHVNYRRSFIL